MIISISGMPGSGKSTVARMVAERLKMKRYYMGGMRREIAREKGLTIQQLNRIGEKEEWTDKEVDDFQRDLGKREDNFVIEGRTSFFLIPQSIKIFLYVKLKTGALRIFGDMKSGSKRNEGDFGSPKEVEKSLKERLKSDRKRYKKYYKVDIMDKSHYDLVIDTTKLTAEQVVEKILDFAVR